MASSAAAQKALGAVLRSPLLVPLLTGTTGFAAWKYDWSRQVRAFVTGPGRLTRILLLLSILLNWKSLPFAWTVSLTFPSASTNRYLLSAQYRVFNGFINHLIRRKPVKLGPRALFAPIITRTHASLLEIDYNVHKSNSTFFADCDVARAHSVCYLLRPTVDNANNNAVTKLILDPTTGKPMKGTFGPALGAVECSFKREIKPFQSYELWTSFLSWDRKWLYLVTYFLPKGTAKPTEWIDPTSRKVRTRGQNDAAGGWERKILATSVAKYVFKCGKLTVHPALILADSGLLPERPGGWMSGENQLGDETADVSDVNLSKSGEWDWRRIEAQRRRGWKYATQLTGLDDVIKEFDGGNHGALINMGSG